MILNFKALQLSGLTFWFFILMVFPGFFLGSCGAPMLSRFEVQRPSRINVPRDVQKVFIRSDLVVSENDQLGLKKRVLETLASELNRMGRFEAKIVETLDESSFNPEKDQIGVIQGEIISGGELDRGRFTDIATCTGGLGGRISSAGAVVASYLFFPEPLEDSKDLKPSSRIVLLKSFDQDGFVFYTNLQSTKGISLLSNSNASLTFHWKSLLRQIRITGKILTNVCLTSYSKTLFIWDIISKNNKFLYNIPINL